MNRTIWGLHPLHLQNPRPYLPFYMPWAHLLYKKKKKIIIKWCAHIFSVLYPDVKQYFQKSSNHKQLAPPQGITENNHNNIGNDFITLFVNHIIEYKQYRWNHVNSIWQNYTLCHLYCTACRLVLLSHFNIAHYNDTL